MLRKDPSVLPFPRCFIEIVDALSEGCPHQTPHSEVLQLDTEYSFLPLLLIATK